MTVKELREALSAFPDDLPVLVKGYEGGWEDTSVVFPALAEIGAWGGNYYGPHELLDKSEDPEERKKWTATWQDPKPIVPVVVIPRSKHDKDFYERPLG